MGKKEEKEFERGEGSSIYVDPDEMQESIKKTGKAPFTHCEWPLRWALNSSFCPLFERTPVNQLTSQIRWLSADTAS